MSPTQRSLRLTIFVGSLLAAVTTPADAAQVGYYRYPALHNDTVVFTAEGDLWSGSLRGGAARRLTTHAADETHAAISPDGRMIAFVANYDSAAEAYVMPLGGGSPRRVSFDGGRVWVQGWTPEGEVLYASDAVSGPSWRRVLRAVHPESLAERTLPLHDANEAAIDPASGTVYFTRFGLQVTGDHAKRYRGGAMAEIWRFDPRSNQEATRLAPTEPAARHRPMWWKGRVYFLSDADGTQNLWSMGASGEDARQITRHQGWDARSASLHNGRIVYQLGADLRWVDVESGRDQLLDIQLVSDFEQRRDRHHKQPLDFLTGVTIAPSGEHLVVTTRGKMAKIAPGPVRRVEIAVPSHTRARGGVLSTDGNHVFAIGDSSGEPEIWRFAADGTGEAKRLTTDGSVHRWSLVPSPDGRWLAHDDKRGRLWLLDLETLANREIDAGPQVGDSPYHDIVWSADSKYLALARADSVRDVPQLLVYSIAERRLEGITSDRYASYAPTFTPDGKWLYFLSDRHYQAISSHPWGDRNLGPVFDRTTKVYAYALQAGERFPFQAKDELSASSPPSATDKADTKADSKPDAKSSLPAIQWAGLEERLFEVPVSAGDYSALDTDGERLYLLDREPGSDTRPALETLAIKADGPQPEVFASEVREFALSADRKKVYFRKWSREGAGEMYLVPAAAKAPSDATELRKSQARVGDWVLTISPAAEWRQMFVDAWRMHRDFAFDRALRGLDWNAVRARHEPLVARVTDRSELDDLIGQMTGELGILHSQIRGADLRKDGETAGVARLGADLLRTPEGARIEHIYRTEADLPGDRGPLVQPGVDARVGEVITAVNGRSLSTVADIAELLHNQAGQQVLLDIARDGETRRVVVVPVTAEREAALRYSDWVEGNKEAVEEAGEGRIGYLHLRAMGGGDLASFARDFYANVDRDGLIVDVRRNRGGNIESWVVEKLMRRAWGFWAAENQTPYSNLQKSFRGHLVVLADQLSYSDGETFPAAIRALGLGPVFGMRTAGAGVWLSDRNRLSDNGIARVAEYAQFAIDGRWIIEGRGVSPDHEVDNLPHTSFLGQDQQLNAALDYLARKLVESPVAPMTPSKISPVGQNADDIVPIP